MFLNTTVKNGNNSVDIDQETLINIDLNIMILILMYVSQFVSETDPLSDLDDHLQTTPTRMDSKKLSGKVYYPFVFGGCSILL